ncbi:MAG: hypothetical protein NTW55_04045 [Planctomycetota bacterium]|nr:hypothetical protein [Planctomycetota bacterium]
MIRFKCIYCGQRILAKDDGISKKGKCPKCKHLLVVPKTTKGRPAISADVPEKLQQAKETLALLSIAKPDDETELYGENPGWLIPTYDELSLFLTAVTLIILYATNVSMREQIYKGITVFHDVRVYAVAVIFLCGMALSIYHIFTTREKSDFEKKAMLVFAVLTNAITGIVAGVYVIKNTPANNWLSIFPMWNIINGALLLLMLRGGIINEKCISDRDSTAGEVFRGLFAVLVVFIFCNYLFKLHWSITFSICIIYATSFDKALQSFFPGLTYRENE